MLRPGMMLPVRAGAPDGPTCKQARGSKWRRTSRGFYVPSSVAEDDVQQRIAEASVLVPTGCAITGWAALAWVGSRWFTGTGARGEKLPITIVVSSHDIRRQSGIEVSGEGFDPRLVRWTDGVPVSDVRYAVSFLMRYARSDRLAAIELEKAAYDDLVSVEEMSDFFGRQNGWTGVPRGRAATGFASENVWSPPEGWMLDVWERVAGYRRPLANAPVFDLSGRHLGTPDLIDPESGVTGEYNGDVHLERSQNHLDLRREGIFRSVGLEPVTMVAPDIADPAYFIQRLDTAYQVARSKPRSARGWTLEQPSWWIDTSTVARRRALTPAQRLRLLRYRSA